MTARTYALGGAAIALVIVCAVLWYDDFGLETYRTFERPDGNYRVVVLRRPTIAMMPGHAGDASGVARLVDRKGHVLNEVDVEIVQNVQEVEWEDNRAFIRLIADWSLPKDLF